MQEVSQCPDHYHLVSYNPFRDNSRPIEILGHKECLLKSPELEAEIINQLEKLLLNFSNETLH
jgi:hypothetical protein